MIGRATHRKRAYNLLLNRYHMWRKEGKYSMCSFDCWRNNPGQVRWTIYLSVLWWLPSFLCTPLLDCLPDDLVITSHCKWFCLTPASPTPARHRGEINQDFTQLTPNLDGQGIYRYRRSRNDNARIRLFCPHLISVAGTVNLLSTSLPFALFGYNDSTSLTTTIAYRRYSTWLNTWNQFTIYRITETLHTTGVLQAAGGKSDHYMQKSNRYHRRSQSSVLIIFPKGSQPSTSHAYRGGSMTFQPPQRHVSPGRD